MKSIVALLMLCATLFIAIPSIYAAATQIINTTVQISVCGNSIIEGGENCEGTDLNSATCMSLGYSGGLLTCDIACTYDSTSCIVPTVTPTLAPTATPIPSTTSATSTPQATATPIASAATEITPGSESLINTLIQRIAAIPNSILVLDPSGEGIIVREELVTVLTSWVDAWKNSLAEQFTSETFSTNGSIDQPATQNQTQCDINSDGECNIIDLSVLLFYVEP